MVAVRSRLPSSTTISSSMRSRRLTERRVPWIRSSSLKAGIITLTVGLDFMDRPLFSRNRLVKHSDQLVRIQRLVVQLADKGVNRDLPERSGGFAIFLFDDLNNDGCR